MRWIGLALAAALLLPVPAPAQQGVPTVLGTLYKGSSSGLVTVQPQAAAGTWNWNWPTSAGTSGFLLTSGGGGSAALTWTSPSITINGTTCTLAGSCSPSGSGGITSLTGDVTGTGPGATAATLATVNSNIGTFQGLTVNAKGLVTAAVNQNYLTAPVANASLANPATTVNGQTCTLGSTCTITASAGSITVGTTTVAGGTDTKILFDNAGVLGNYTISGTGNVAMTTSPTIASPTITGAFTATGLVTNADLANASMTIGGQSISLGGTTTNQGNGGKIQLSTGTTTTDNCAKFDASGNVIDAGASCGSGSGSVTSVATSGGLTGGPVTTTGTISCIDAASTIKGCPTPDGTATHFLNGAGGWTTPAGAGTVTSVTAATPNGTLSLGGTNPVTTSGTINFDLNLSHANTWAAAQTFTNSDLLLLGSSTGATTFTSANAGASNFTLTVPARTATLGTTTGTLTSGNCVKFDASGNSIDAGAPCGTATGDVVGPGSSTAGHFAIFDGITGKLLKDTLGAPAASATTDTTNASNISSGTLSDARLPTITNAKTVSWDSTTAVTAQTISFPVEWTSYTITSVKTAVNGGGSFSVNVKIGSTSVTSCSAISVSGSSNTSTSCTAANTGSVNDIINVVITSPSGTINQAYVAVVFTHTVN